ncbi:hypothetical protein BC941DRAFT_519700 [Chlamydoabsidia padenii]|nr:hypothetical protein BC941DRAFT_519700 [Chlamydoabsidia padenii]
MLIQSGNLLKKQILFNFFHVMVPYGLVKLLSMFVPVHCIFGSSSLSWIKWSPMGHVSSWGSSRLPCIKSIPLLTRKGYHGSFWFGRMSSHVCTRTSHLWIPLTAFGSSCHSWIMSLLLDQVDSIGGNLFYCTKMSPLNHVASFVDKKGHGIFWFGQVPSYVCTRILQKK